MDRSRSVRRSRLGRRLSRRLSLVARAGLARFRQDSRENLAPRRLDITLIAPDKTQRNLSGEAGRSVESLLAPLCAEFCLPGWPLVRLAGSQAEVDPAADLALLEAEIVILDPRPQPLQTGGRKGLCLEWERAERVYISRLRSALPLYGSPLSQVGILAPGEFSAVFGPLQALADRAHSAANKMKDIIEQWDDMEKSIGQVFSPQFWDQYDLYQDVYRKSKQLLREKARLEEDFEELVRLRRGAALFGLHDLLYLPVQRLSQYEEYLEALVKEAQRERLREDEDIQAALTRAKQAVKRAKEESDLERIQDLFPNDSLKLYDKDVLTMRMKGLMRKRPSPAARLTRALSAKSLRPESPPPRPPQQAHRHFIMESPVQFSAGVQSQDRHLFLFNDLLLIAKARSGGNFKLKEKVRVSEVWLSTAGLEEVSELARSRDTSFVLGWPTTNVVATFSTQAARDLWLSKLNEVVNIEKAKEPSNTNIQVTYYDQVTNIEYVKTLSVSPDETARGAMLTALSALDLPRTGHQLWAQSAREESPYPLIGHERPAAIKLSCLRDALSAEEGFDLDHCNNVHDPLARCQFILRNVNKSPESLEKKRPKKISGRMRIGQVFRRSLSKETPGCLFGLPLSRVCQGDNLPPAVISMLQCVATKGPFTVGMFRKSANVRFVRELRSKLDAGQSVQLDTVPVLAVGALLKDFLRSLPDPLLTTALYPRWRAAIETPNLHQRLIRIKSVVEELPRPNRLLLRYVLCALVLIARRCNTNLMSPANLGVCVGPSLLWQSAGSPGDLRAVPALVEALITHAEVLAGPNISSLLGDPRDSGTEESDSLRRDDSSIDSLECSPPPRKDKISLSRDSGLTMSDSQLYTPDEEESTSTSSSGYDPAFDQHAKVTATVSVPGEYVRVYGGWEERLNPNFQRQAWFRQRSRRLNSVPNQAHSASQDDLLGRPTPLQARSASQESVHQPPVRCEVISEPRRARYRPPAPAKEDSSTLSDEDCTPHVSRSNSRGNEVRLRHLPPVHVESAFLRGRMRRREERPAHRSRSLPPAPANKRAPITSYYLPDYIQPHCIVTRAYRDEESYV